MAGKTSTKTLTFGEVWKTLAKVDVNTHIEKKGGLSYLSWAWAWGILMEDYPMAEYTFGTHTITTDDGHTRETDVMYYPDGTGSVSCLIRIGGLSRDMWLPVMDYRNNAIQNPTSRQISDTKMRCLVKCMAMFGLGHYIYAGEDLPTDGGTTEGDFVKAGMPTPKAPTAKHTNTVAKPKKLTKAQLERMHLLDEIRANQDHTALNEDSTKAVGRFLTSVTDGTPKSEIEKWHDKMMAVISEHGAREKERVFLEKQEAKVDSGAHKDLFETAAGDVSAETVGV